MAESLETVFLLTFFGSSFSWEGMSVSHCITEAGLSPLWLLPSMRRILRWWHPSSHSFRLFWQFASVFLGCSFLDKYFEIIFSRLTSRFSKNAFQVASSSISGRLEPGRSLSVPEAHAVNQLGALQGPGPSGIGQLGLTNGGLMYQGYLESP